MAEKPTKEQVVKMAHAAMEAVYSEAESMGLDRMCGLYGIEHAWNTTKKTAMLLMLIGPEAFTEIGMALEKQAAADAVNEAEEILKGEM